MTLALSVTSCLTLDNLFIFYKSYFLQPKKGGCDNLNKKYSISYIDWPFNVYQDIFKASPALKKSTI